jgi:hypothetical protein
MTLLVIVVLLDGALGFFTSVRTKSATIRFFTWLGISLGIGMLATGLFMLRDPFGIFSFPYCVVFGLVATGLGSLLGYFARMERKPEFLFRPKEFELRKILERGIDPPYQGPRCVACEQPITSGTTLCPKCGYTQPIECDT